MGEFLCSHFNIGNGRKYAVFSAYYLYFIILVKIKMQLKHKKRFAQCTEKVL